MYWNKPVLQYDLQGNLININMRCIEIPIGHNTSHAEGVD